MKNIMQRNISGFTLIELLVVVLIIGILSAVVVPMYQGAVDKSRYSTLMPMAKSVANAQEAFYMANGNYSVDLSNLDVQLPNEPSGSITTLGDGTSVELSERDDYNYVKLSTDKLENNYVMYQVRSSNYSNEIHCEAKKDSNRAERLCVSLGGEKIDGYLTPGYETYVLEGNGMGLPLSLVLANVGPAGWQSCDTYPCTKECDRELLEGYTCVGTYNEDHSYQELFCQGEICSSINYNDEGIKETAETCVRSGNVCNIKHTHTYDEKGNLLEEKKCASNSSNGECSRYYLGYEYDYDENGNKISERTCSGNTLNATSGDCVGYTSGHDYTYDENGNKTSDLSCSSYTENGNCKNGNRWEYQYDENGNQTGYRSCYTLNSDGTCASYNMNNYDYTYDENGNLKSERHCYESNLAADGSCNKYSGIGKEYTYDENNNQTSQLYCNSIYSVGGGCRNYIKYDYEYDGQGNKTSERYCSTSSGVIDSDGNCNSYASVKEYSYDSQGNQTSEKSCGGSVGIINSNGTCDSYDTIKEYTYDDKGNQTSVKICDGFNSDGSCNHYEDEQHITYDEFGNKTSHKSCHTWTGITCTRWSWSYY